FATVSDKGVVTGVAAGTATITAKAGAKTATCVVTVTPEIIAVTSIALEPVTVSLEAGKTTTLVATVLPENATNKTVTWTTSAETFATVSDKGVVTGVAAGTATITAKAGAKTATCVVTVTPEIIAVTSISLDHTKVSVEAGKTAALVATVLPENATNRSVTWTTSAAKFATVSDKGVVTGVAVGEATITATAGDKTATSVVTVTPIPVVPYDWYDTVEAGAKVYTVSTAAHLLEFGNIISGLDGRKVDTFAGKTVQLAKDIDISTVAEWRPIGGEVTFTTTEQNPDYNKIDVVITPDKTFQGTFDGATHSISGLSVSKKDAKYGAFFVALKDATVKNINFTNINMVLSDAASTDKGCDYASVVGVAENTKLTDINVSGKIQSTRVAGIAYVVADGTKLTNCVSSVTLISKTKIFADANKKVNIISGGLVGQVAIENATTIDNKATLELELFLNCEFNGTLTVDVSAVAPSWVWVGQLLGATSYPTPATNGYYTLVVNNFKANGKLIVTDAEVFKALEGGMPDCFNGVDLKDAPVVANTINDHHDVHNKLGRIHKDLGLIVK
ncbi:MAG: Ig-like domain-containing protein, partial [Bacilli bacterium]